MRLLLVLVSAVLVACGGSSHNHSSITKPNLRVLNNAVVALLAPGAPGEQRIYCSGFFVSDTEVVTAAHCIDPDQVTVRIGTLRDFADTDGHFYNRYHTFVVTRVDSFNDLALLSYDGDVPLPFHTSLSLAAEVPEVGDNVVVVGHPTGILAWTYTTGIVSYASRNGWGDEPDGVERRMYIQYSANSYYGNSGGPVLNCENEVVGVVSEGLGDVSYIGMGTHLTPLTAFLSR